MFHVSVWASVYAVGHFSAARTLDIADCSQVSEACSAGAVCLGLISEWCCSTGAVRPGLAAFGSVYGTGWSLALLVLFCLLIVITFGEYFFLEHTWSGLFTFLYIFTTWPRDPGWERAFLFFHRLVLVVFGSQDLSVTFAMLKPLSCLAVCQGCPLYIYLSPGQWGATPALLCLVIRTLLTANGGSGEL